MSNIISFSTGVVDYSINDKVTVAFNPTDVTFITRVFSAFDALDAKQDEYAARVKDLEGPEIYTVAAEMDKDMRVIINEAFGADICEPVFGEVNIYALADGLPLWANLMLAILDEMDSTVAREKKATNPRLEKYTKKYAKKK